MASYEELSSYFRDRECWARYTKDPALRAELGMSSERPFIHVNNPSGRTKIRSMLSLYEAALLYMLGKEYYSGQGEILDLGPLVGLSTNAFARGLHANTRLDREKRARRIHSFDLFHTKGYRRFFPPEAVPPSRSAFMYYLDANRDYLDNLSINPGNLLDMGWRDQPVEILFIDVAKSWELNQWVLDFMFPNMMPGRTIVVQQDWVHFNEYWIHLTMEYFAEYFDFLYVMRSATAVFWYKKPIPESMLKVDLRNLPLEEKQRLLSQARAKMPAGVQEVMKTAHAKCLAEHGRHDAAIELLDTVQFDSKSDDPSMRFEGTARGNTDIVRDLVERLRHEPPVLN